MSRLKPGVSRRYAGQPCHYCGAKADTVDHIVPLAIGGTNGVYNLVPACRACNLAKGDQSRPDHCDTCAAAFKRTAHSRWHAGASTKDTAS